MSNPEFDVRKFWEALDATRQSRNMTWKLVANKTGVAASTLTRIGQGKETRRRWISGAFKLAWS